MSNKIHTPYIDIDSADSNKYQSKPQPKNKDVRHSDSIQRNKTLPAESNHLNKIGRESRMATYQKSSQTRHSERTPIVTSAPVQNQPSIIQQSGDGGVNLNNSNGNQIATGGSTIINKEEIFHPDDLLFNRIKDSVSSKTSPLLVKYDSRNFKNREFAVELVSDLRTQGYTNVSLIDGQYEYNLPGRQIVIYKSQETVHVFVSQY